MLPPQQKAKSLFLPCQLDLSVKVAPKCRTKMRFTVCIFVHHLGTLVIILILSAITFSYK